MAAPRAGERVLDVACGTGLVTFPAAEAVGNDGVVVATDLSEAMVTLITAEAGNREMQHVSARRMDAEALDFPDESFDVALCALGLMYVPDPEAAVRQMTPVVRRGGRVALGVWGARNKCGWADIFPIVDARVQSEVCPMFFQPGTGDALRGVMERAGLGHIEVTRLSTTLRYSSPDEACAAAFSGGPVALAYSRFDSATREEVHAEYLASIERWRRPSGYEIPGEFVVACGVRP
jgi:SAM-dependent methyltransferase